jgi:putative phosphoesterase
MRIGIISDTHDRLERTQRAVQLLIDAGAVALIHCGDLTGPAIVEACGRLPGYFVFGNNDADSVPALRQAIGAVDGVCLAWGGEIVLAEKRIAVAHGHFHRDTRALLSKEPDYYLYGHSHIPEDKRVGDTRWINPGALHRAAQFTVAVLDLNSNDLEFLPVPR